MRIHIDLGAIFRFFKFFKRNKNQNPTVAEGHTVIENTATEGGMIENIPAEKWVVPTAQEFKDCACDPVGIFEDMNINDIDIQMNICNDIVYLFGENEKNEENFKQSIRQGFNKNQFPISEIMVAKIVNCYKESFIYEIE